LPQREHDLPERIDLAMLFSRLHEKMGEPDQALALARQASEQSAALPANDPQALAAQVTYAYSLMEHGDAEQATPLMLALEARVHDGAPLTGMPLIQLDDGLAELADNRGEHALALDYEQRALAERVANFGAESPKAATGYNNAAIDLDLNGRHAEAIEAFRRSYAIHRAHEGADSFETANARNNLAIAETQIGRLQAARADLLAVEAVYQAAPNNKRTRNVQYWQNRCLLATGIGGAQELPDCTHAAQAAQAILAPNATRLRARALRLDAQLHADGGDFAAARTDLAQADAALGDVGDNYMLGINDYLRATFDAADGDAAHAASGFARALERIGHGPPEQLRLNALALRALACAQHADAACPGDAAAQARAELDAFDNAFSTWLLPAQVALARLDLDAGNAAPAVARLRRSIASATPEVDPAQLNLVLAETWLSIAEHRSGQCAAAQTDAQRVREKLRTHALETHPALAAAVRALDAASACAAPVP
jgi:hypothetical protein